MGGSTSATRRSASRTTSVFMKHAPHPRSERVTASQHTLRRSPRPPAASDQPGSRLQSHIQITLTASVRVTHYARRFIEGGRYSETVYRGGEVLRDGFPPLHLVIIHCDSCTVRQEGKKFSLGSCGSSLYSERPSYQAVLPLGRTTTRPIRWLNTHPIINRPVSNNKPQHPKLT